MTAYVHNCVSRLRRALGRGTLETRPSGYVVHADPETIDVRRFERLLAESRRAGAAERATLLVEALGLWRGPALADFAFETFAQAEIRRLEELRLTALEERIEAELELGRHAELAGELEALAHRHPARERLRRLEMLALYRSGRQLDALRVYQETRLALVEEYGLEPGEELRALERMVIAHDPALAAAVPAAAEPRAPRVAEQRRTVSLVFAELSLPDGTDPEVQRRITARCLAELTGLVEEYGGSLEQLLGEELAAVFGVPHAHEDDVLRAVRTAVAAREEVERVAAETGIGVSVRVGVESGEVVVGGDGPALSGSAVGAARRVKDAAARGEILLGPAALRLAAAVVDVVPAGDGYRLLGLEEGATAVPRRFEAPLVGRADELAALRAFVDETVAAAACRRFVVLGDPGIGKSRLALELVASLGDGVRALTGRCVPYGAGATYLPLAEALRQALGPGEPRAALDALLAGDERREEVSRLLLGVLGADEAGPAGETAWAVRRLLEALAAERPLVLVLEDVHWAESALLDLVEYLTGWSEGAPIAVVCLARPELPEQRPEWGSDALVLGPLSEDDARALVAGLPGVEGIADSVLAVAEGNPLFLEQVAAHAAEEGLAEGAVPPSLDALLASRLDRLAPDERAVLERASVAGREFTRSAVDALSPLDEAGGVGPVLLGLVRRRLLRPDQAADPAEDGFRFDHALVRDAAYAAVPKARRADLHERLARWLDERPAALDEIVGYHLEQAAVYRAELGEPDNVLAEEARVVLRHTGFQAFKRLDLHAAAGFFDRAAVLAEPDSDQRLELEVELACARKALGDFAGAVDLLERVAAAARSRGDRRLELRAQLEEAYPKLLTGAITPVEVRALVDEGVAVFETVGDRWSLARAWQAALACGSFVGVVADIELAAAAVNEHYQHAGFPPAGASSLANALVCGQTPVAEGIDRCISLLESEIGGVTVRLYVLIHLARLEAMSRRFSEARGLLRQSQEGLRELRDLLGIETLWSSAAAHVERLAGDPDAVERLLAPVCTELAARGERAWLATHLADRADAAYRQRRPQLALSHADEALRLALDFDVYAQVRARCARGKALAALGRASQGEDSLCEALGMIRPTGDVVELGAALVDFAEVLRLD
ncbi:MAG TPA: BTAD domain-containing putative transcriptional regulator, partial [Gaiellaceae bacterium]|nr:BTAD domain-containing putative transcriptional regulator [Gaiellaceae bacterium]